jgi:hypothetical protein
MQAIHADQQDVVDIGRLGARAKRHAGQQAECDLSQYHKIVLPFLVTAPRDCGSRIFHADDGVRSTKGRRAEGPSRQLPVNDVLRL